MKFIPPQIIGQLLANARRNGQKIVLATGVFDVLHDEHRHFLESAKAEGDLLLIGLESDARVKQIKGESRPINDQQARVANLEAWQITDGVFILPKDFDRLEQREALIESIQPDVLAVSSHTAHLEEKRRILAKFGGQLKVVYQHNPAVSSTKLLNKNET